MSGTNTPPPALSRTIDLPMADPPMDLVLKWLPKSPGTEQDYSLNVAPWAANQGETVTGFTAMVSTPGSTISPLTAVAQPLLPGSNTCTVRLAGGVSATQCSVTFVITTATRTITLTCWIVVVALSGVPNRFGALTYLGTSYDPGTAAQIAVLTTNLATETQNREDSVTSLANSLSAFEASVAASHTTLTLNAVSSLSVGIATETEQRVASHSLLQQSFDGLGSANSANASSIAALTASQPASFASTGGTLSLTLTGGGIIAAPPATLAGLAISFGSNQTTTLGAIAALSAGALQGTLTGTAQALPAGAAPTFSVTSSFGTTNIAIGVPQGGPGPAIGLPYSGLAASFNASTNVTSLGTTLAAGGAGGAPGAWIYCATAGSSSITGSPILFAVGDYAVANTTGTAWIKVAGQSNLGTVGSVVLPNAANPTYMLIDNGIIDGNKYWTDGFGNIGMILGATGLQVAKVTASVAVLSSLNVTGAASFAALTLGTLTTTAAASIAGALNVQGPITSNLLQVQAIPGSGMMLTDNGVLDGVKYWTDGFGNIGAKIGSQGFAAYAATFNVASILSLTVGTFGASNVFASGAIGITSAFSMSVYVDGLNARIFADDLGNAAMRIDGSGVSVGKLNAHAGIYTGVHDFSGATLLGITAGGSGSQTFSPQDIANIDAANLAAAAKVKGRGNTTAQRATAQFPVQLTAGQSRRVGTNGGPGVNTTQPLDNLSYGASSRGVQNLSAVFVPVTDGNFHPLVAVPQISGQAAPIAVRTGALTGLVGVSVAAGSSNGTISWTGGGDATTIFAPNDGLQMSGWQTAVANNPQTSNAATLTVFSVAPNSIVVQEKPSAGQVTAAPETGITIAQANYNYFAEDTSIAQANEYRKQYLNRRFALSDTAHMPVITVPGIARSVASQSPANNGITPTTLYFSRYTGALSGIQNTAANVGFTVAGVTYKGTACLTSIEVGAGGDESGYNIPKATFRAQYDFFLKSIVAAAFSTFGAAQTGEPYQYSFAISGPQLSDGAVQQAWAPNVAYVQLKDYLIANGNIYVCAVSGTSATSGTGPSGTGLAIADGSAVWNYLVAAPVGAEACPLAMAILELFGCSPSTGFAPNYAGSNPNRFLWGPEYAWPDRGAHGTNLAYVMTGCQIAKVRTKVELNNEGWLPCHVKFAYVRGAQVAVSMHVPEPPMQIAMPFQFDAPIDMSATLAFVPSDKNGPLTILSATLPGQTVGLLVCNRLIDLPSFLLRFAPAAGFNGAGPLCDSDPWVPAMSAYSFMLGSGQLLSDNFAAPTGSGFVLQNGKPFALYNWLCPGAWPGTAY